MPMSNSTTTSTTPSATCLPLQPKENGYLPPEACDVILYYIPSLGAAILFSALFGLSLIAHGTQAFLYKKKFSWVVMMGACWECLAFVFRGLLTRHQNSGGYNTAFNILFFLAPLWINAFLYMTLGRLIHTFLPSKRLAGITASNYAVIFVWLDVVAFIIQAAGAVLSSNTDASTKLIMIGVHIYMGGIGFQELFIIIFTILCINLHRQMLTLEKSGELTPESLDKTSRPWRWLFYTIYFSLAMITIRIVFRLCQFSRGMDPDNPVLSHEVYEYLFDATPMFVALLALNLIHPGMVLRGPESEFPRLSRKEKKRIKDERKEKNHQATLRGSSDHSTGGFESLSRPEGV